MAVVPEGEPSTDESSKRPFRALLFFGINVNHRSLREPLGPSSHRCLGGLARGHRGWSLGDRADPASGIGAGADACGPVCDQDLVPARELVAALEDEVPRPARGPSRRSDGEGAGRRDRRRSPGRRIRRRGPVPRSGGVQRVPGVGRQEIFRFGHVGVAPVGDAYLPLMFGSDAQNNVTGFGSADLDRAMADAAARGTWDELEREIMTDAAPVIPVARYVSRWAVSERVSDLEIDRDGTFDPTVGGGVRGRVVGTWPGSRRALHSPPGPVRRTATSEWRNWHTR